MKTIRQIREAARTPERAHKLLDRIAKHKNWHYANDQMRNVVKGGGVRSAHLPFNVQDKGMQDVDLKKVRSHQETVSTKMVHKKLDNPESHEPSQMPGHSGHVRMIYRKDKDQYDVYDGNHRVSAHRLLGRKTIRAKVYE